MKTVKFITLGCKTNFYESAAMAELLRNAGYDIIESKLADIYIINTCTVTNSGAAKSRAAIKRCKQKNPKSIVAVTGCYAQMESEKVSQIDGVDIVSGVERGNIVDLIMEASLGKGGGRRTHACGSLTEDCLEPQSSVSYADSSFQKGALTTPTEYEELTAVDTQSRVRAVVKIQDGCDNYCSYCVIPYARGHARSRKLENIISEAYEIANRGYSEIVLTGINLSSYGKDLTRNIGFIDVIEKLHEINGISRIRLGSLSPTIITEDFVSRAERSYKLCPQFHLSLQSGSDKVLENMNRKYDTAQYFNAVKLLKENIPNAAITTDLIVGFPGETDAQFEESYEFCKKIGFSQMHIFKYSKRAGTVAAEMKDQIPKTEKERRSLKMLELARNMKEDFYQNYIGKIVEVLFETEKAGKFHGLTANYMDVLAKSAENLEGKIKKVKITGMTGENLVGEVD